MRKKGESPLKAQLAEARAEVKRLTAWIERLTHVDNLQDVEITLLTRIAQESPENSFEDVICEGLGLSKPRLDYHLQRLLDAGCVEVLLVDPAFGGMYGPTQKGREVLGTKGLL